METAMETASENALTTVLMETMTDRAIRMETARMATKTDPRTEPDLSGTVAVKAKESYSGLNAIDNGGDHGPP
jgi:hypothetical protein